MSLVLNIIYIIVSILFFAGRMYELISFTDFSTGFMSVGGVVSSPLMLILIFVIAFSSAVIAFPFKEEQQPNMKFKIGAAGYISAVIFIAGAIINIINIFRFGGFLGFDILVILGSVGLLMLSATNIQASSKEKLPFVMTMLIPVVYCIRNIIFDVSSISNTIYLSRNLAYIITFAFLLMLFKNGYAITKHSDTVLYGLALLNFTFSGMGMLAFGVAQSLIQGFQFSTALADLAFVPMGILSLLTVFNMNKKFKAVMPVADNNDADSVENSASSDTTVFIPAESSEKASGEQPDDAYQKDLDNFYDSYKKFLMNKNESSIETEEIPADESQVTETEAADISDIAEIFDEIKEEKILEEEKSEDNTMFVPQTEEISPEQSKTVDIKNLFEIKDSDIDDNSTTQPFDTVVPYSAEKENKKIFKGFGKRNKKNESKKTIYRADK